MATAFIHHADCVKHDMGSYHPESPGRYKSVEESMQAAGLLGKLELYDAPLATDEQLARAHPESYIEAIRDAAPATGMVQLDPDTAMNPYSLNAALRAAGSGVLGIDLVMEEKVRNVFCNVRPCGHHATRNRSMGFCIFNNIAVAAFHATEVHKLDRVAIVDFDVHHGNGTEDIFFDDPRVMMCSFYQHPFYPNLRREGSRDHMVNIPVDAYTTGFDLRQVVSDIWVPRLYHFAPQMLFISAGFDAHREDEMGQLGMVEGDYAWITDQLVALAERTAQGRIVSMLEGGYNLSALGRSAVAHIRSLSKL